MEKIELTKTELKNIINEAVKEALAEYDKKEKSITVYHQKTMNDRIWDMAMNIGK